jgi:hypothetical protein
MRKAVLLGAVALGLGALALTAALVSGPSPPGASAASHREAPAISLDGPADITDFFFFRGYEPGTSDKAVLIMNTQSEEPSSGPNYWNFDPSVLYSFKIDNDRDGKADDVEFQFRFRNEPIRGIVGAADLFLNYVALPPITALDGPNAEGLGFRQRYDLVMVERGQKKVLAQNRIAVPSNVGPRTMPDYDALAAQGIYDLGNGIRLFAGQRDDPFYIDLGGVFDTLNFGPFPAGRTLPIETTDEDANDGANAYGVDMLSGFNVQTIALEVPISMLTADDQGASTAFPKLGAVASTSRPLFQSRFKPGIPQGTSSFFRQVQRLANPLVNEAIIPTELKDEWNSDDPQQEDDYESYYLNPRLALAMELVFGVPAEKSNRTDLRDLLLKYQAGDTTLSDLLRLDVSVAPTPLENQRRLTVLAGDNAGWPNGRRPKDDVTDIAIRVVGGPNYVNARAADGINTNDRAYPNAFPYLSTPHDGRNRVHQNRP